MRSRNESIVKYFVENKKKTVIFLVLSIFFIYYYFLLIFEYGDENGIHFECFSRDSLLKRGVDKELSSILSRLNHLDNALNCTAVLLHSGSQGFGVQFVTYYTALADSLRNQNCFAFVQGNAESWNYFSDDFCDMDSNINPFDCFFEKTRVDANWWKLHQVFLPPVNAISYVSSAERDKSDNVGKISFPKTERWNNLLSVSNVWSPRWLEGQLANSLFCPNKKLLGIFKSLKHRLGLSSQYIGVHIRRKDRIDLANVDLSYYFDTVLRIREVFGTKNVFIATDDPKYVLKEARLALENKGFKIFSLNAIYGDIDDFQSFQFNGNGVKNKQFVSSTTEMMMADLFFLSESTHFIGAQRSLFSWVASRIRVGKGKERHSCPNWIFGDSKNFNNYGYLSDSYQKKESECI